MESVERREGAQYFLLRMVCAQRALVNSRDTNSDLSPQPVEYGVTNRHTHRIASPHHVTNSTFRIVCAQSQPESRRPHPSPLLCNVSDMICVCDLCNVCAVHVYVPGRDGIYAPARGREWWDAGSHVSSLHLTKHVRAGVCCVTPIGRYATPTTLRRFLMLTNFQLQWSQ